MIKQSADSYNPTTLNKLTEAYGVANLIQIWFKLCLVDYLALNRNLIQSWWCHQMETFSALLTLCEGNAPITNGFLTKASNAELWCFIWSAPEQILASRRDAGDLRRHCAHYSITVMNVNLSRTASLRMHFNGIWIKIHVHETSSMTMYLIQIVWLEICMVPKYFFLSYVKQTSAKPLSITDNDYLSLGICIFVTLYIL